MTNADLTARTATSQATVERCLAELRRGGAIALMDGDAAILAVAAENLEESVFAWLSSAAGTEGVRLLLTAERASRLGLKVDGAGSAAAGGTEGGEAVCICHLTADLAAEAVKTALIRHVADPTGTSQPAGALDIGTLDLALDADPDRSLSPNLRHGAIDLAKTARLLPAMVVARVPAAAVAYWVASPFTMDHADLATHRRMLASQLRRVGSARVPLEGAEQTEIIAFRPSDGGKEHLAIVIGRPDPDQPVLIRLHSECFTGDLLGSLRCDCGDQLRGAIEQIAKSGSGILLYLAQEGRGIGLINKLRAYRLQDAGADTLDANLQLGFGADERVYQPAAEMLRQLGIVAVRLLTNNPDKVRGLEHCGIRVTERVAHTFPSNDHNARYLSTKATRFGHMF
jgi:GTP cyclohydrolase II